MKNITTLLFTIILTNGIIAQEISMNKLLERLDKNHMGSITDVFSSEELLRLRDHLKVSTPSENTTELTNDPLIHTTENVNENFSVIDPESLSTVSLIAPSPLMDFEGAGATIPDSMDAMVVDNSNNLYRVAPDGSYTSLGQLMPAAGQSFTGLEYTSDGRLFGIASDGAGATTLYEINTQNQSVTSIGLTGLVVGISLGRDSNNELYALDIDTNSVHRINKNTGAGTVLGPIGFNASFGQGMGYDPISGNLLCTCFNNDIVDSELRIINTVTGASALVGEIVPPTTLQFGWMSIFDSKLNVETNIFENISITPNPVKEVLHISGDIEFDHLSIHSILGKLVLEREANTMTTRVNVSNLKPGIYFISLTLSNKQASYKFIKQ